MVILDLIDLSKRIDNNLLSPDFVYEVLDSVVANLGDYCKPELLAFRKSVDKFLDFVNLEESREFVESFLMNEGCTDIKSFNIKVNDEIKSLNNIIKKLPVSAHERLLTYAYCKDILAKDKIVLENSSHIDDVYEAKRALLDKIDAYLKS